MDNSLHILGIAKKAGLLAIGEETVASAGRTGKARAVFSACDASERSKKRAQQSAESFGAVYLALPYTKLELAAVIGRGTPGVLAVLDAGLAAVFAQKLAENNPEAYAKTAELLQFKAGRARKRKKNSSDTGKNLAVKGRTKQ